MLLDMTSSVRVKSAESAASHESVIVKRETTADPWQNVAAEDRTFPNVVAAVSEIYRDHRISDPPAGLQHQLPWYRRFDQIGTFGAFNVAFGMKPSTENAEGQIWQPEKTERKTPPGFPVKSESGDPGRQKQPERISSDGSGAEVQLSELRPPRVVASIVPTQFADSCPTAATLMSNPPPPLVPVFSSSHHTPSVSFGSHVSVPSYSDSQRTFPGQLCVGPRSPVVGEVLSDSEPEADDGHCSPPPQRINQEAHRSTNAL